MFFLIRSALCIGLVAYMLPATESEDTMRGLANKARSVATDPFDALCSGCAEAQVAKFVLSGSLVKLSSEPRQRSVSTLLPSDLVPAWMGPVRRS